jgi:acylphosphatase
VVGRLAPLAREQIVSGADPSFERREVHFSGRVQGVGFRYTVRGIAARHDVRGYVKNLNDGRVLLVVEGPRHALDALIGAVQAEMERYIADTQTTVLPVTGEFTRFEVRH